jgi:hypothetical protein
MQDAILDSVDSTSELEIIRQKIESLPKFNQVEILRILSKDSTVTLNENKYGTFINLTELPQDIIENLKTYINYVNTQEYHLNYLEKQKEEFKNIYFTKDNKDNSVKNKYA